VLLSMMLSVLLAAVLQAVGLPEKLDGQLQSAIWSDLQTNALIGNGNWLASLWYQAGSDSAPNLHIQELTCERTHSRQRCSFVLHRDGGPVTLLNEIAPDNLACVADFVRADGDWSIVHTPPRRVGHSETSMRCNAVAA
jgi:hypothetical protein